jgi:hypothetical protein
MLLRFSHLTISRDGVGPMQNFRTIFLAVAIRFKVLFNNLRRSRFCLLLIGALLLSFIIERHLKF